MKRNAFGKERIKNGRCREDTDETCPQKSSRGAPLSLESRSHLWLGLRSDAGRGGGGEPPVYSCLRHCCARETGGACCPHSPSCRPGVSMGCWLCYRRDGHTHN